MAMSMDHGALDRMRPDGWLVQVVLRQGANGPDHISEESVVALVGVDPMMWRMSPRGYVLTFYFDEYADARRAYDLALPWQGIASQSLLRVSHYTAMAGMPSS